MSMDDVLARLKDKWAGKASDASKADVDSVMESVRSNGVRREGQSVSDDRIAAAMGQRRLDEAIQFTNDIVEWIGAEARESLITRWQGYFAAALLTINLRAGCPISKGGAAEFDRTAGAATEWFKAKARSAKEKAVEPVLPPTPTDADVEKGATFAQNLLDWFESEVNVRGLDRWQGHFAAALLTVELRASCPGAEGGVALFDSAVDGAWAYFETMSKI